LRQVRHNAIAAALKKLTPEQRKAVKTDSGRAYTTA
jgi:hypothetical protein